MRTVINLFLNFELKLAVVLLPGVRLGTFTPSLGLPTDKMRRLSSWTGWLSTQLAKTDRNPNPKL